jgi:23S rRNA (cytosine1962-C5)-methyltransferase
MRPRRHAAAQRSARRAAPAGGVEELVDQALARRAALLADPQTTVARLMHGEFDGVPGLVVEKLGSVLIAQLFEGQVHLGEAAVQRVCELFAARLGARAVYRKIFPRDRSSVSRALEERHHDPTPWMGTPAAPEFSVLEHGLRFLVRPYDGYLTGLFLDHRLARQRVRELAAGRRVLNAFAYTCGFGLAAARGGAQATVNVDLSRKALEWGKRNLAVNDVPLAQQRFVGGDIFAYYRRAVRQRLVFDFVILDPPSFARRKGGRPFVLEQDLSRLVTGALDVLARGGVLQLSLNHRETSRQRMTEVISTSAQAARRRCEWLAAAPVPPDFCGDSDYGKSVLVRAL